jgi:formylglycine-generating enzyme
VNAAGPTLVAAALVVAAVGAAVAIAVGRRGSEQGARCGSGFVATGPRCLPLVDPDHPSSCFPPLVHTPAGCDGPRVTALIPAASVAVGPSDWEAQGRVQARSIRVQSFRIDAFEVTRGRLGLTEDPARAASAIPRDEAAAFCVSAGGRLPTEDEWIVAAASAMNPPRRYPWGDTGAVCRRAAWGLQGACASGADGPDTVGAHATGDSPLGLHDLAGNVAEWVSDDMEETTDAGPAEPMGLTKGGSWRDTQASELRIWARRQVPVAARDPAVGFRCVYAP